MTAGLGRVGRGMDLATRIARHLALGLRRRVSPVALRLAERVLARAGFPTNRSGNNTSMR